MTTSTTTERRGMTIRFYPGRLSNDALGGLADLARDMFSHKAPKFVDWLLRFCWDERQRRLLADMAAMDLPFGEVPECDFPLVAIRGWTDTDVADGLLAATILSYAVKDPCVGEFMDRVVMAFVSWAGTILRQGDATA